MRASWLVVAGISACLSASCLAADIPAPIAAAVSDTARPAADTARDAGRKPAETLGFVGIKPGAQVAELLPGGGYFTRLLSTLAGPKGHVYALTPPPRPNAPAGAPDPAAAATAIAADPEHANVSVQQLALAAPALGLAHPVDVVWTSDNYHDLHNLPNADVAGFNQHVFEALKPGGMFIVIDHAAAAGHGTSDTKTLHRIDPEAVKAEVTAAGFKLAGSSDALANQKDDHTLPVFDPGIRGKTDQFILKFIRPR